MSNSTAEQGDRGFIDWTPRSDSAQAVEDILSVVHYYRDGGHPAPTVRDVYYDLLGWYGESHGYVKGEKLKRKVYRLLTKMRRARMVAFSEINDDSFESLVARSFKDPRAFMLDVSKRARSYHKNLAENQPKRIIVFTEGAGAVRQFHTVACDYTIPVYSPGGWDSVSLKHETAMRAYREYDWTGRQTVVLHAGDFDPDGVELFRIFTEDVHAFVAQTGEPPEDVIIFKRVMLQAQQVAENKKTHFSRAELKDKNHRGLRWPYDFKAELQSLSLPRRLEVMRVAIEREIDHAQLEADRRASAEEREEIRERMSRVADEYRD